MAEPTASTGTAVVIFKYLGVPVTAAALGTALGFIVLWPRTKAEGFARFFAALLSSFTFGPAVAVAVYMHSPEFYRAAANIALLANIPQEVGILAAAAPFLVLAALPAWWVLGWVVLFLDRRRHKDLGGIVRDIREVVKGKAR